MLFKLISPITIWPNFLILQVHQKWHSGPELKTARSGHVCAIFKNGSDYEVVAAGGSDEESNILSSVEVLKLKDMKWTAGCPIGL